MSRKLGTTSLAVLLNAPVIEPGLTNHLPFSVRMCDLEVPEHDKSHARCEWREGRNEGQAGVCELGSRRRQAASAARNVLMCMPSHENVDVHL